MYRRIHDDKGAGDLVSTTTTEPLHRNVVLRAGSCRFSGLNVGLLGRIKSPSISDSVLESLHSSLELSAQPKSTGIVLFLPNKVIAIEGELRWESGTLSPNEVL